MHGHARRGPLIDVMAILDHMLGGSSPTFIAAGQRTSFGTSRPRRTWNASGRRWLRPVGALAGPVGVAIAVRADLYSIAPVPFGSV